ncbi:hypothetical protein [Cellulomonas dongxiuzhuiae]|uniref:Core-binding (CB) domain-containing protein n=1 Tax=Cellulomonas dongxiuzhuiae TaxID=2819979 RepID=A0ABX8GEL3_9CELL|nr:hypothetical protein [Cellulomonas dongxiuzhuiae]MBO3093420.1 hypothetical protein [Cellulomonas dongxiuzhuiae]QWC14564.1 hypothetical protein KKR89_09145 [Cellulomonas dongxiuzhuiae]
MPRDATVEQAVGRYLGLLGDRHPSTARAYRWALANLRDAAGEEGLSHVLGSEVLAQWLVSPTGAGREPSAASVRQRATAARGLVRFATDARLLDAPTAQAALEALSRPATPAVVRDTAPARLLLARAEGRRPHGVSWHVWVRFRAHALTLADTGATERDLARACVTDLAADRTALVLDGTTHGLGEPARHAVGTWLSSREQLVATLQGSPPPQLWVRAHPSVHPRTGAVAAVGMPITARGLRKAFQDVVAALVDGDPRLGTCTVAHVRALAPVRTAARGEPATPARRPPTGPPEGADEPG